jgi:hypothetical protein
VQNTRHSVTRIYRQVSRLSRFTALPQPLCCSTGICKRLVEDTDANRVGAEGQSAEISVCGGSGMIGEIFARLSWWTELFLVHYGPRPWLEVSWL